MDSLNLRVFTIHKIGLYHP